MDLLVEVQVRDNLPVNGTWEVPSLSAVDLIPVLHLLGQENIVEWTEENVFRASRDDNGKIKIECPIAAENYDLLKFCVTRIIEGMVSAALDAAWSMEIYARIQKAQESGLVVPQAQVRGPLKL